MLMKDLGYEIKGETSQTDDLSVLDDTKISTCAVDNTAIVLTFAQM